MCNGINVAKGTWNEHFEFHAKRYGRTNNQNEIGKENTSNTKPNRSKNQTPTSKPNYNFSIQNARILQDFKTFMLNGIILLNRMVDECTSRIAHI